MNNKNRTKFTVHGLISFNFFQIHEAMDILNCDKKLLSIKDTALPIHWVGNHGSYRFVYKQNENTIHISKTLPAPVLPPLYKRERDQQQYSEFTLEEWMYINLWVRWFKNDYKQGDEGYERKFDFPEIVEKILIAKAKELVDGGLL